MRRRKRCVTHSSLPSGVMSMQSGPPGTLMVATTFMSWVSISDTVPSTRLLRNQCRPSPFGQKLCAPLPVCRRPTTAPSLGSTATRPSSPVSATSRRLLSGSMSDAGRRLADLDVPLDGLGLEVEGDHPAGLLQGDEHRLRIGVERHVARQAVDEDAAGELEAVGMVDVDVVEPVGDGDEPLAVRAEAQLVGIDDVAHDAALLAGLGVEHQQLVGRRRADQHVLAVGRRRSGDAARGRSAGAAASTRPLRLRML